MLFILLRATSRFKAGRVACPPSVMALRRSPTVPGRPHPPPTCTRPHTGDTRVRTRAGLEFSRPDTKPRATLVIATTRGIVPFYVYFCISITAFGISQFVPCELGPWLGFPLPGLWVLVAPALACLAAPWDGCCCTGVVAGDWNMVAGSHEDTVAAGVLVGAG